MPDAIKHAAGAIRRHAERQHERRGRGNYEGEVKSINPLRVDAAGIDQPLTDDDITIASTLASQFADTPLKVGDTLVLIESDPGDYTAIEVLRDDDAPDELIAPPRLARPALPVFLGEPPADHVGPCLVASPADGAYEPGTACAMIYRA